MTSILELTFTCLGQLQGNKFPLPYIHFVLNQTNNANRAKMVSSLQGLNDRIPFGTNRQRIF